MEWVIWLAVLFMIGSTVTNVRTKNQVTRALSGSSLPVPTKGLEAAQKPKTDGHSLVRTWIVSTKDGSVNAGWRWRCACGVWGLAADTKSRYNVTDKTTAYSLGTEKSAIEVFKEHALQYSEVNTDFYKAKFEKEQADFAEYRRLCYCKETNHDLLNWKDK